MQGGSGYQFFAPSTFAYLSGKDPSCILVDRREIPSQEVQLMLEKVSHQCIYVCYVSGYTNYLLQSMSH